jgi:hypothetical protein
MIGKIKKGHKMVGLVNYLAGPGRANEHTDMHVVAASELVVSVGAGEALNAENTKALGQELDRPKKTYDPGPGKRPHVFHVSLSIDPEAGVRDDAFWSQMANEYLSEMGFTGEDGLAPCRWAAIRHGVSGNGNDHVHIAVSMIREDGTRWSTDRDFKRSATVLRGMEERHGLRVLGQGVKTRGYAEGELESVARRRAYGRYQRELRNDPSMPAWKTLSAEDRQARISEQRRIDQPREEMTLRLRAAGAQARDEGEYVRRMRGQGLLVRPRFAKGTTNEVVGYSVALRPTEGESPIWYGGGTLAKDLTLPALRVGWPDSDPRSASDEWRSAVRNGPYAAGDRRAVSGEVRVEYFRELSGYADKLAAGVNTADTAELAKIARAGAGVLSSWAVAAGQEGADDAQELRRAARGFSRHSSLSERPSRAVEPLTQAASDMAMMAAAGMSKRAGNLAVIRAWANLGEQLGKAFVAHDAAVRADRLHTDTRQALDTVHGRYQALGERTPLGLSTTAPTQAPAPVATKTPTAEDVAQARGDRLNRITSEGRAAGLTDAQVDARIQAQKAAWVGADTRRGSAPGGDATPTSGRPVFKPSPPSEEQRQGRKK